MARGSLCLASYHTLFVVVLPVVLVLINAGYVESVKHEICIGVMIIVQIHLDEEFVYSFSYTIES